MFSVSCFQFHVFIPPPPFRILQYHQSVGEPEERGCRRAEEGGGDGRGDGGGGASVSAVPPPLHLLLLSLLHTGHTQPGVQGRGGVFF